MPGDVTRDEFTHLAARVSVVEREVEGEKLVTRHILEQTRRNGDDLAAVKTRLDRVEGKVDSLGKDLNRKIDAVAQDVTGLRGTVHGLASNLPRIVGDAVREAMRARGVKR